MKTYGSEPGAPEPDPQQVGISEFAIATDGETLKTYGLGSCLAIALWDPDAKVGGLAHVMLPDGDADNAGEKQPGKYADTAIRAMLRRMVEEGATYTSVQAKVAGGSDMFQFESFGDAVGERNVVAAREELHKLGVPIVAEEVGGNSGRTVEFDSDTGTLAIHSAENADGGDVTEL